VNPLLSLAGAEVYRIPMILLIGWRGEPGVHDEPQHITQGRVTPALLEAMEIPCVILDAGEGFAAQLRDCSGWLAENGAPYAFLVRKDTFGPYTGLPGEEPPLELSREEAIGIIAGASGEGEFFFSTTGMASRELYELRERLGQGHGRDFLTVGSMGHASSLALAAALRRPGALITCLDGDGAALMHLGALAAIGERKPRNLRHILLNNGAHDSVGGQPTIARAIDLPGIARACGYPRVYSVRDGAALKEALSGRGGPVFIEVMVRRGARQDLGRPRSSPEENKRALMAALREAAADPPEDPHPEGPPGGGIT
ncbi:MAG: phosphonopyruvate decarboxylase, partial [Spirochaetaceae bacterium]|jgi:phosphonopyruvate decarboxylase|nr:phosphonopyruvate decarboxylase [Spirochaetaceae bacterium]